MPAKNLMWYLYMYFMQENDMQFVVEELLEMARGVASGMKCLSEMGFVHRVSI